MIPPSPGEAWEGTGDLVEIRPAVDTRTRARRLGPTHVKDTSCGPPFDQAATAFVGAATVVFIAVWASLGKVGPGVTGLVAYGDAQSHQVIARQVWDGATTGLHGLGTVWLPLPHVMMALFSWWLPMWSLGVAGIAVGAAMNGWICRNIYALVRRLGAGRAAGYAAALALGLNTGWAYVCAQGMTEPVAWACFTAFCVCLARFAKSDSDYTGGELILWLGSFAALGVLSRYEGWGVALVGGFCIAAVTWSRHAHDRELRSWVTALRPAAKAMVLFGLAPAFAACFWMWHSWRDGGDPLAFVRGDRSAQAQQQLLEAAGRLPTKHNAVYTAQTLWTLALQCAGPVMLAIGLTGLFLGLFFIKRSRVMWAPVPLLAPLLFQFYSLYSGQSAAFEADSVTVGVFNVRFGMNIVIPACLGFAVIVEGVARMGRFKRFTVLPMALTAMLLGACVVSWWPPTSAHLPLMSEGAVNYKLAKPARAAAEQVHARLVDQIPDSTNGNGMVGLDDTSDSIVWWLDLDLDHVATDSNSVLWARLMEDPTSTEWLLVNKNAVNASVPDRLVKAIEKFGPKKFASKMDLVWSDNGWELYHRINNP